MSAGFACQNVYALKGPNHRQKKFISNLQSTEDSVKTQLMVFQDEIGIGRLNPHNLCCQADVIMTKIYYKSFRFLS